MMARARRVADLDAAAGRMTGSSGRAAEASVSAARQASPDVFPLRAQGAVSNVPGEDLVSLGGQGSASPPSGCGARTSAWAA